MALNLQVTFLTVPFGTEFPGTVQELGDLLAQYQAITGGEDFNGINYGDVEPDADNRDLPWFRLDDNGLPLGWYSWNGTVWVAIPVIMPSGTTAQRPATPTAYQQYFDTDIDVAIIFDGASWVTLSGSPGDCKFVKKATLAEALTFNPGWVYDSDVTNMVIGGASSGSGLGQHAYGTSVGAETVTLVIANLPSDAIKLPSGVGYFPGAFQNGSQAPGIAPVTKGLADAATITTGPINGGVTQTAVSILQPTFYRWPLVKS